MKNETKQSVEYSVTVNLLNIKTKQKKLFDVFCTIKVDGLEWKMFSHKVKFGFGPQFKDCYHETTHTLTWEVGIYSENPLLSITSFVNKMSELMVIEKDDIYVRELICVEIN